MLNNCWFHSYMKLNVHIECNNVFKFHIHARSYALLYEHVHELCKEKRRYRMTMNYSVHNFIGIGESKVEFTVYVPIVSTSADAHKRCHAYCVQRYGVYVLFSSQVIFFLLLWHN